MLRTGWEQIAKSIGSLLCGKWVVLVSELELNIDVDSSGKQIGKSLGVDSDTKSIGMFSLE